MEIIKKIFKKVSRKQCSEFGQVAVLICIFLALYQKNDHYIRPAFLLLLITILFPYFFYPVAVCWFGLSTILGRISSFIILNILFIVLVIPMGLFRKISGRDIFKIETIQKSRNSVMTERNHLFASEDLEHTF
ncbi:MAG: hypothetical protein WDM78_13395 [Puia sp.]